LACSNNPQCGNSRYAFWGLSRIVEESSDILIVPKESAKLF
jgi:hypothetical protein